MKIFATEIKYCYQDSFELYKMSFSFSGEGIEHVNTICLPLDYPDAKTLSEKNLVVAGWGWVLPDTEWQQGILIGV